MGLCRPGAIFNSYVTLGKDKKAPVQKLKAWAFVYKILKTG